MDKGSLYLVATPIGNTADISQRAIEALRKVDLILCEDTRHSGRLLKYLDINNKLMSYHEHNERQRSEEVIGLLKNGENVALISDAGSPCISDPGTILVDEAHKHGISVVPIPGPSALIAALSASGFQASSFQFLGFLPRKEGKKREILEETIAYPGLTIIYESPKRLVDTLTLMVELMADRRLVIARELTKLNEEIFRGSVSQALERYSQGVKGEIVIVLDTYELEEEVDIEKELRKKIDQGYSHSKAVKVVAKEFDINKNDVYKVSIEISNNN